MTPEEALNNILELVGGSDEVEDAHSLQILFCRALRHWPSRMVRSITHRKSKDSVLRHQNA